MKILVKNERDHAVSVAIIIPRLWTMIFLFSPSPLTISSKKIIGQYDLLPQHSLFLTNIDENMNPFAGQQGFIDGLPTSLRQTPTGNETEFVFTILNEEPDPSQLFPVFITPKNEKPS